ncbi:MAG: hypothetical protein WCH00_01685 [Candidatus Saccharibacteria bacterium]
MDARSESSTIKKLGGDPFFYDQANAQHNYKRTKPYSTKRYIFLAIATLVFITAPLILL